ncbi:uncharacterized protein PFL1_00607 [Pseudozyma flocculosa PF-1]|uniref:uncharacterized protein n=1 Tax=Pseudozyma flocculosa PF-1 TaxID=1277687 RepID=UPI000456125F|nr:uncharacterized protein PFL1_00607 [Pseudozyma flocculosa PF-1]EPQ32411.1 hypothetical protein PFL1_00607 [Pseudozyma flocculosa PF-1]
MTAALPHTTDKDRQAGQQASNRGAPVKAGCEQVEPDRSRVRALLGSWDAEPRLQLACGPGMSRCAHIDRRKAWPVKTYGPAAVGKPRDPACCDSPSTLRLPLGDDGDRLSSRAKRRRRRSEHQGLTAGIKESVLIQPRGDWSRHVRCGPSCQAKPRQGLEAGTEPTDTTVWAKTLSPLGLSAWPALGWMDPFVCLLVIRRRTSVRCRWQDARLVNAVEVRVRLASVDVRLAQSPRDGQA